MSIVSSLMTYSKGIPLLCVKLEGNDNVYTCTHTKLIVTLLQCCNRKEYRYHPCLELNFCIYEMCFGFSCKDIYFLCSALCFWMCLIHS